MSSTFKSNDTAISDILKSIESGQIQLPDFQRGWVWDDNRIKALIASISNAYPVGALMFLEFSENGEIRFKYRPFTGASATEIPEILVLDGQQRMTSIFNSLYSRNPVLTRTDKNKEIKRYYYLDIEKSLNSTTDRVDAVISVPEDKVIRSNFGRDIELDVSTRDKEYANKMFPLNIVYDLMEFMNWLNGYQKYHNYNSMISQQFSEFNKDILNPIQSYKVPVITLEKNTSKEAVCQVFENVNSGGVSLTVFELVTATFAADNFELRKDWEDRMKRMIDASALSYANHDQALLTVVSASDFLTAITLLDRYYVRQGGGEAISCKKRDVLKLTLEKYQKYSNDLTEGFIQAANFIKEQRIFTARDLPYSTQLIPLSVIFTILKSKAQDSTVKQKVSSWYWCGVFGEMYGGANETRYAADVSGIDDKEAIYIGEAEEVYTRLHSHLREKDFWNEVIVFISKDDNLNKAHIKYIENKLHEKAKVTNRYEVLNGNIPPMPSISESDRAEMDEFISNLIMIVNTLGHKVFEEIKDNADTMNSEFWYINAARGAKAKGIQTQEGFVVLKGSKIASSTVDSFVERLAAKREDLIASGKVQIMNEEYIVMEDLLFSSPSLAAAIVMGRSANGLTEWKDKNGKSLKDIV